MQQIPLDQADRILTELLRTDFRAFLRKVFSTINPGVNLIWEWYLDAIADHLDAVRLGHINKLIINQPPRTLKSISSSVALPAYMLGHDASTQIIGASYGTDLSLKMSTDCRLVIESPWYQRCFPDTELSEDQNQKWRYLTTKMGHRTAVSVESKVTGFGADLIVIDDPETPNEALSDAIRKSTNLWIRQNLLTRFNDRRKEKVVIVQQRVHEDDTTGNLIEDGGWTHLNLPAEFIKKTIIENPLGKAGWIKEEGDLLAPELLPQKVLENERIKLGEFGYAGQYLQNPAPLEGGLIKMKWFKRYNERPFTFKKIIHSWDTAIKANAGSDYSCCLVWGIAHNGYYLLDVILEKMEYPDLKKRLMSLYLRDNPEFVLVEDKASGQSLIQDIAANTMIPMIPILPYKDKIQRLSAVSTEIEGGNVYLPEYANWLEVFEQQVKLFPNARHDDAVDALSQFLGWAKNRFDFSEDFINDEEDYEEPITAAQGRNPVTGY